MSEVILPILAIRSSQEVKFYQGQNAYSNIHDLMEEKAADARDVFFSGDGTLSAYCNGKTLKVRRLSDGEIIFEVTKQKTSAVVFSPNNTFIALWEIYYTTPQNPQGSHNSEIYNIKTGECVRSVIFKNQSGWAPAWTFDEELSARCVSNEVQFFKGNDFHTATKKLYLQNVAGFAFSPAATTPYMVAAHIVGKKGLPSSVRLFQYPNFDEGQAIANKSFFKADKVDIMWNKKGNALLVLASAEVDTSGSSYYGETSLHFISTRGDSNIVTFDKRGPIYCLDWNPNSTQFCVVYGFMPAKATLFNLKCEPVFDFGLGPRNLCKYNPHGNILCLAGFGNLNGNMEMWNVDGKKVISKPTAEDTTHFEWCPDGAHYLTATLSPRLRVNNGFKIWHFTGRLLQTQNIPKSMELYQATWQPTPTEGFPVPKVSGVVGVKEVKKEAYRPPSARNGPSRPIKLSEDEAKANESNMSAAALKNKKKRENKAKARQEQTLLSAAPSSPPAAANTQQQQESTGDPEVDKKIKALRKKLRAINDLKQKQKEGKPLEKNQLDKLSSEKDLIKELRALGVS